MLETATRRLFPLMLFLGLFTAGCDGDDGPIIDERATFTVTVENVSMPNTITTDRAMGTVPLSPGAWVVFTDDNPMFSEGEEADSGTELIAEDGFPSPTLSPPNTSGTEIELLQGVSNVVESGTFQADGGPDSGPALFAGESAQFTFVAESGDRLQLEVMFVQSNDWFFAFGDGGLDLFDGGDPVSGDVTDEVVLYDAGTEADTAPGTGPDQKPAQDPAATDVGPEDDVDRVEEARDRHPGFTIPANAAVIRVTITAQQQ